MASIDLSEFDCARCAEAARKGHDLKAPLSGAKGSCEGPQRWPFFAKHASGGFTWEGCPRAALTTRTAGFIRAYDACDGRLTYTEQRSAPGLLVDAFSVIAYARGVREAVERADAERAMKRKG